MQFRDLKKQYQVLKEEIDEAMVRVASDCNFISGQQVKDLEKELAEYVGVKHCITCANGTDAITLALKTWNIGVGDAVFVPDFTFFASGESPALEGATSIFVDVRKDTFNMDPIKLETEIIKVISEGKYNPRVVVVVDLFGQPAECEKIKEICNKYNMLLLEDAAQGFGGKINNKVACSFGDIATTSFFPAKPLGCYGDGGAIFTNNDEWDSLIRSYAVHGKGTMKYDNVRIGMNSRLDTLQAAILQVKFKAFKEYEVDDVNKVAGWYNDALKDLDVIIPTVLEGYTSSWAQYSILLPENIDRNTIQACMKEKNIPTMVYYPKPMHTQVAFSDTDSCKADTPVTDAICKSVLALPIHPYMSKDDVEYVASSLKECIN